MCFDNSYSKLSEKMVFFEVIINSQNSAGGGGDEWVDVETTESLVEYKLEDMRVRGKNKEASAAAMIPLQTTLELSDSF